MPPIISFGKTTPALLAGRKTVTRRTWAPRHAAMFYAGLRCPAWNQTPRVKGSKQIGWVTLTEHPLRERASAIPDEDWEGEGFAYMTEHGIALDRTGLTPQQLWDTWRGISEYLWVVRFTFEPLEETR